VGEYVVAIGNPFGLGHTVTMGIISAKSRTIGAGPYDDFIQTDASINPGNSGGPLFNLLGQVIGINTAINPNGRGIGFAIPSDALKDVLPQLVSTGHVARGRIGVGIQPVDSSMAKALGMEKAKGALVGEVEPEGPAAKAGIAEGDVIVGVEKDEVAHANELPRLVARHAPGTKVTLRVLRDKNVRNVDVTLDALRDNGDGRGKEGPAGAPSNFGLELDDAPNGGALVRRVSPSGAARDQIQPGDVILEINRTRVGNGKEAAGTLRGAPSGKAVLLKVRRNNRTLFVAIDKP
jgi:serine protease Do